jgi:hypothetical protein
MILLFVAASLLITAETRALPGTHGRAVSTWDTTRSTIVFDYSHGFLLEGGYTNQAAYNANFTSTTGRLSAQFGLQYVNYKPDTLQNAAHGISGSAVAVYGVPFGKRFINGLPRAAFTFYLGSVPTGVVNGEYNYFTIPLVLGLGLEFSPARVITITPWFELAPSLNIDTVINPYNVEEEYNDTTLEDLGITVDPETGYISSINMPDNYVYEIVQNSVIMDITFSARLRGGLSIVINLGDKVDLQLNGIVMQVGSDFSARPAMVIGAGLAFAWDDPPPAILPAATRLKDESCTAVEARFVTCPGYRDMEERIRKESAQSAAEVPPVAELPAPPMDEEPAAPASIRPVSPSLAPAEEPSVPVPAPAPLPPAPYDPPAPSPEPSAPTRPMSPAMPVLPAAPPL